MAKALITFYLQAPVERRPARRGQPKASEPKPSPTGQSNRTWLLLIPLSLAFLLSLMVCFALWHQRTWDSARRLRARLDYFAAGRDVSVAVVERNQKVSTLVSYQASQESDDLHSLAVYSAKQVGLDPARLECLKIGVREQAVPAGPDPALLSCLLLPPLAVVLLLWPLYRRIRPVAIQRPSSPVPEGPPSLPLAVTSAQSIQVDELRVEIGPGLVDFVQETRWKNKVEAVRNHMAQELGLVLPGIRFRSNPLLESAHFRVLVRGREVARNWLMVNRFLTVGPEVKLANLSGVKAVEPTFGQPGVWIGAEQRGDAERLGCMMFDAATVWATLLTEVVRTHCAELLTYNQACELLEQPQLSRLVTELEHRGVDRLLLWKLLRQLLAERVSIGNLQSILEAVLDHYHLSLNLEDLVEFVRQRLGESIVQALALASTGDPKGRLQAWKMPSDQEQLLRQDLSPEQGAELLVQLEPIIHQLQTESLRAILITTPDCRRRLLELTVCLPDVVVLSTMEISDWSNLQLLTSAITEETVAQ